MVAIETELFVVVLVVVFMFVGITAFLYNTLNYIMNKLLKTYEEPDFVYKVICDRCSKNKEYKYNCKTVRDLKDDTVEHKCKCGGNLYLIENNKTNKNK